MNAGRTNGRIFRGGLIVVATTTIAFTLFSTPASAVVVVSDGFGDADLNNNGTPLEFIDVDVNHDEATGTYTPARASNGSMATTPELTTVLDSNDTGWDPLESTCRHASLSIL